MKLEDLEEGQKYRLRYRSSTQYLDREAVMVFLGWRGPMSLSFSARPAAGTQDLPVAWIKSAEPVPASTTAYVGRVVRD